MIPDDFKSCIVNEVDFRGWPSRKQRLFWLICKYDYKSYPEHWETDSGDYLIYYFDKGRASFIAEFTDYMIEHEREIDFEDNLDDDQPTNGWNKIDETLTMEDIGKYRYVSETIYGEFWGFVDATI